MKVILQFYDLIIGMVDVTCFVNFFLLRWPAAYDYFFLHMVLGNGLCHVIFLVVQVYCKYV